MLGCWLLMDEVTRDIQGSIPWCMLFSNDVVLVDECYRVGGEYAAARLTPHRGLIAGDIEAQQWMSQSRRRSRKAFSPRRPKISHSG
jgi:hypothetical protein